MTNENTSIVPRGHYGFCKIGPGSIYREYQVISQGLSGHAYTTGNICKYEYIIQIFWNKSLIILKCFLTILIVLT